MKIYFKDRESYKSNLFKFAKVNGAEYFNEDDKSAVWIGPKFEGTNKAALRMNEEGLIRFGYVNQSDCFDSGGLNYPSEVKWIIETCSKLLKYKPLEVKNGK